MNTLSSARGWAWLLCLVIGSFVSVAGAQEDGVFVDFKTNQGDFTARLEFEKAPQTTANFVGLATGTQPWIDVEKGRVSRAPYYEGITFHRVVKDFVIQAGSPNGMGTDGPGYTFRDEFDATLRHDAAYVLSMANSGLHSNGSQFFITLVETAFLDDVHSVFGKVIEGTEVIDRIGAVAVDGSDRPVEPVVINSVSVRHVGEKAEAFDVAANDLPLVRNLVTPLQWNAAGLLELAMVASTDHALTLFRSQDLMSWAVDRRAIPSENRSEVIEIDPRVEGTPREFFRLVEVAYPETVLVPESVAGKRITLDFSPPHSWTLVATFDETGAKGTYTFNGGEAAMIDAVDWRQEAYRGVLTLQFPPGTLVPIRVDLVFEDATTGTFNGRVFQLPSFPVSGSFTAVPAE